MDRRRPTQVVGSVEGDQIRNLANPSTTTQMLPTPALARSSRNATTSSGTSVASGTRQKLNLNSIIKREILAIVRSFKYFKTLLLGAEVCVYCDNTNSLFAKPLTKRTERWKLFLEQFNYSLQHIAGKENKIIRRLFRLKPSGCYTTLLPRNTETGTCLVSAAKTGRIRRQICGREEQDSCSVTTRRNLSEVLSPQFASYSILHSSTFIILTTIAITTKSSRNDSTSISWWTVR